MVFTDTILADSENDAQALACAPGCRTSPAPRGRESLPPRLWITSKNRPLSVSKRGMTTSRKCPSVAIFRPLAPIARAVIHIFGIYLAPIPLEAGKSGIALLYSLKVEAVVSMCKNPYPVGVAAS